MSAKRMDNEAFNARQEFCRRGEADRHTQRLIAIEAERARASEAQKDAVIKALADALERHGWACRVTLGHPRPDVCGCVGCDTAHALRLAGRL